MKKLLAVGFSAVLFLGACSDDSATEETDTTTNETEETSEQNADTKKELMRFYMAVPKSINEVDGDLNAFEAAQTEDTLPEGEELTEMKENAMASAEEAAANTESIEIPGTLEEQQGEIEEGLALIQESYEMKSAELANEEVNFEAANEKFQQADEIFNGLLEEQGLIPSSLYSEVSN